MTKLGEYLEKKSVNKARVARKTNLGKNRLTALTNSTTARLTAEELYLIALAIEANPAELLEYVCGHLKTEAATNTAATVSQDPVPNDSVQE